MTFYIPMLVVCFGMSYEDVLEIKAPTAKEAKAIARDMYKTGESGNYLENCYICILSRASKTWKAANAYLKSYKQKLIRLRPDGRTAELVTESQLYKMYDDLFEGEILQRERELARLEAASQSIEALIASDIPFISEADLDGHCDRQGHVLEAGY